jgi:hypothetical protein
MAKENKCLRHVFIGYDEREDLAYQVCRYSILSQLSRKRPEVKVHKLDHRSLRKNELFSRKWTVEEDGNYRDISDKKPFSTQFSHSRFLVPALCKQLGIEGQALFVDCDFLFKGDINDLFDYTEKNPALVHVVKHDFVPTTEKKMDGVTQKAYTFKLWSALMMFNLEEPKLFELLLPDRVNKWEGQALHRFMWIHTSRSIVASEICAIPEYWHFIPDHSEERVPPHKIRAMHYTLGGPWFEHMRDCKYANDWWKECKLYVENELFPEVEEFEYNTRENKYEG